MDDGADLEFVELFEEVQELDRSIEWLRLRREQRRRVLEECLSRAPRLGHPKLPDLAKDEDGSAYAYMNHAILAVTFFDDFAVRWIVTPQTDADVVDDMRVGVRILAEHINDAPFTIRSLTVRFVDKDNASIEYSYDASSMLDIGVDQMTTSCGQALAAFAQCAEMVRV